MAYGNWGAWVFRNGEHMPRWEDNTPFAEERMEGGYWQAFGRSAVADGVTLNPQHAILGQGALRLCGYKDWPKILVARDLTEDRPAASPHGPFVLVELDLKPYVKNPDDQDDYGYSIAGEYHGYRFETEFDGVNMIDLALIEPDGVRWSSRCGYCYGAGHDEEPRDECRLLMEATR